MMKPFGISFKGGLARGFGAIGIIRFLEEEGLKPQVVAGSSSGAIIAASIALGYDWQKLVDIVSSFRFREIISLYSLIKNGSLVSYKLYEKKLLLYNHNLQIEDLPIKLIIFATDPTTNDRVYVERGSLIKALIASSGFPVIFPSIEIKSKRVLDGDLTGGFSPHILRQRGAKVVMVLAISVLHILPQNQMY